MHPDVQVGLGDREAAKMSPHKDFEDFEEYVFSTWGLSSRLFEFHSDWEFVGALLVAPTSTMRDFIM